jgi:hypothetical protein
MPGLSGRGYWSRKVLEQYLGKQGPGRRGPANPELVARVDAALRGPGVAESVFITLADEIDGTSKPSAEAVWIGVGKVRVGNKKFTLESQLADVLQSLVELGAATEPQLRDHSGHGEPVKLLRKLVKKFPLLAPYIHFPGKRGGGGYSTTIVAAPS